MKIKRRLLQIPLLFCPLFLLAQLPYTQKQYPISVETNIPYGMATTFAGGTETLVLDLYKPIGDNNCRRPLLVMAHGGGFIAGTKNDVDVVQICQEMAARGYVTASINYRLGVHPLSFYTPYALCNDAINPAGISKCIYMTDTLEFTRALHRAVQDVRGAIRFLKERHELDSTDVQNVFTGGSSAGAIATLHLALLDLPSEKLPFTGAQADAPVPDGDLASCVPMPANRTRPDLGPADGDQNLNGQDATVQGVAAFMGGVFDLGFLQGNTPPLYLYHRTDDLVVPCNTAQLFGLYPYCLNPINLCQPLGTRPWISGSCAIRDLLSAQGTATPPFFDDILTSYGPADGDDCFDNPPGHSIDNIPLRCENLSGFFAGIIAGNGNSPTGNCVSNSDFPKNEWRVNVFPNPARDGQLNIVCSNCPAGEEAKFRLVDAVGRSHATATGSASRHTWDLSHLPGGMYFLFLETAVATAVRPVVLVR